MTGKTISSNVNNLIFLTLQKIGVMVLSIATVLVFSV